MFNKVKTATAVASLVCLGFSGPALAGDDDDDEVINSSFTRIAPDVTSGSGHTVRAQCGGDFDDASATLKVEQEGANSEVKIKLRNGKPNTVYTVWLRLRGTGPDGSQIGWHQARASGASCNGSPLTCGGATPLVNSASLGGVIHYSPPFAGTPNPTNGFTSDNHGNGSLKIDLDFPVVGGAYPFHRTDADALADWQAAGGNPDARTIPTAIVNPADGMGGPFLMRIVSHCQDGLGHGLSPSNREAWFDWPI